MLDSSIMSALKRVNVSKNVQLTSNRADAYYKKATRAQKNEIDELSGLKRVSIYRVAKTGAISARAAIAMAAVLGIDPFFLTAESDQPGEYSEELLYAFLKDKGYAAEVKTLKNRSTRAKNAAAAEAAAVAEQGDYSEELEDMYDEESDESDEGEYFFDPSLELSEDEAVFLLRALHIRARYDQTLAPVLAQIHNLLI